MHYKLAFNFELKRQTTNLHKWGCQLEGFRVGLYSFLDEEIILMFAKRLERKF